MLRLVIRAQAISTIHNVIAVCSIYTSYSVRSRSMHMHDNSLFGISWWSLQATLFFSITINFFQNIFHFTINSLNSCILVLLLVIESNKLHRWFLQSNLIFVRQVIGYDVSITVAVLIMSIESCPLLLSSLNRCFHSSNVGDLSDPEIFSSPSVHMLVTSIFPIKWQLHANSFVHGRKCIQ